jgi:hypothetical protein
MAEAKWDWQRLSRQEQTARWDILTNWVAWLQETYEEWVTLPDCWPRHEALRAELEFFRAWHAEIFERDSPSEGADWHASLRSAAEAWAPVASCTHEERPWAEPQRFRGPVFQQHLRIARDGSGRPRHRPSGPGR